METENSISNYQWLIILSAIQLLIFSGWVMTSSSLFSHHYSSGGSSLFRIFIAITWTAFGLLIISKATIKVKNLLIGFTASSLLFIANLLIFDNWPSHKELGFFGLFSQMLCYSFIATLISARLNSVLSICILSGSILIVQIIVDIITYSLFQIAKI